jgi:HEAT repeat protein
LAETRDKDPLARAYTFLSSTHPFFRREGVRLLGQIASVDPEAADALIRMLRDENEKVQEEALRGLGKAKIRAAVPAVVELLEDPYEWTRASAVDTLRKILEDVPPDAEVLEVANAVAPYLSDEGSQVREAAINAIAAFEPPWAVESLAPMLRDPDRSIRGAALASLAGFDSPEVRTRLRAHYDESDRDDPFFSFSIAAALRNRGDDAAIQREGPRLVELATTSLERDTRVAAYRLLAERGGAPYRALLEQALGDPDPVIREVAREALAGM